MTYFPEIQIGVGAWGDVLLLASAGDCRNHPLYQTY